MRENVIKSEVLVFVEPRLLMGHAGRLLVRVISVASYGLLIAAAGVALLSDLPALEGAGALLALFLLHRLLTLGRPDIPHPRPNPANRNVARALAPASYRMIEQAFERAALAGGDPLLHLLRRLTERGEVREALVHLEAPPERLLERVAAALGRSGEAAAVAPEAARLALGALAERAFLVAAEEEARAILPRHLFAALGDADDPALAKIWQLLDVAPGAAAQAAAFVGLYAPRRRRPTRVRHRVMNRAWTARPTPTLDAYAEDLTDMARAAGAGHTLIGHRQEFEALLDVLARPGNENALLVGPAGAGKRAILERLAHEIARDRVPAPLFDRRVVSLDLGALLAAADEGEVAARLRRTLAEIMAAGNIILVLPDLHQLARTSGLARLSAADMLLPVIKSDAFPVIGATTPEEYARAIEGTGALAQSFEVIRVEPIGEDEAVRFLALVSRGLERERRTLVSFRAIREAVRLARQFLREKPLPGSAVDLLREAFAEAARRGEKVVGVAEVRAVAERETRVPLHTMDVAERQALLNLESRIHERFVDQDEAVAAVSRALREYRSGLSGAGRTIANFLFVGPTGVGKTELARALAALEFGSESFVTRLDMTEFVDAASVTRLIGSADGSVRGALTEPARVSPYALLLLDEFEKAHREVTNLFLRLFDEGTLTDGLGRTVSFENSIVIATSNAHADLIQAAVERGETASSIAGYLKERLTDVFPIELLNRFTDVIVFRNLTIDDLRAIVRLELAKAAETLEAKGITLRWDDSLVDALARWGYDPQFGARPLKRAIDERLMGPLSERILRGDLARGDTLTASAPGDSVTFS